MDKPINPAEILGNNSGVNPVVAKYFETQAEKAKELALRNVTPEKLEKLIVRINASNTDTDREKLSPAEMQAFLKANITELSGIERASSKCRNAHHDKYHVKYPDYSMQQTDETVQTIAFNIQSIQEIAKAVKQGGRAADKKTNDIGNEMADRAMQPFLAMPALNTPDNKNNDATKKFVTGKFRDANQEAAFKIKAILQDNPKIVDALIKLPKITDIETLQADDACKHLLAQIDEQNKKAQAKKEPPKGQPKKGQGTIALR